MYKIIIIRVKDGNVLFAILQQIYFTNQKNIHKKILINKRILQYNRVKKFRYKLPIYNILKMNL